MNLINRLAKCTGFDRDEGNILKSWERHRVSGMECEQLFFNRPLLAAEDIEHSKSEERYYALGQTDAGRTLFVVFTVRRNMIRVISARDMNKRERKEYEQS